MTTLLAASPAAAVALKSRRHVDLTALSQGNPDRLCIEARDAVGELAGSAILTVTAAPPHS
jgi:hypothetical protein